MSAFFHGASPTTNAPPVGMEPDISDHEGEGIPTNTVETEEHLQQSPPSAIPLPAPIEAEPVEPVLVEGGTTNSPIRVDEEEMGLLERFIGNATPQKFNEVPIEVILLTMQYLPGADILRLRQVCSYFQTLFMATCSDHLRSSLQPPPSSWFMNLPTSSKLKEAKQQRTDSEAQAKVIDIAPTATEEVDHERARNPLIPSLLNMDEDGGALPLSDQPMRRIRRPSGASLSKVEKLERQTRSKFTSEWLHEINNFNNTKHNIRNALFNYATIEKHSHAMPLILPSGILCFSRWQLIAVFVKVVERDNNGREIKNSVKWIKAGYLGSHTDTVTSMRYDARSNTMLSSSFDGTIKRWNIRDPVIAGNGAPPPSEGLFTCVTSYHISVNGVPANNFQIFSFDVMDLKDVCEQPGEVPDQRGSHGSTSLICCGGENGHVALLQIEDRRSATLGLYNTGESRIRAIRFLNIPLFTSDTATDPAQIPETESGTVHIVLSTVAAVHILQHVVTRRVVTTEIPASGGFPAYTKRSYHYSGSALHLQRLQTLNFADFPVAFDVPQLRYNWPTAETTRKRACCTPDQMSPTAEKKETSTTNMKGTEWNSGSSPTKQRSGPHDETIHGFGQGNPFFTAPCIFFFYEDGCCSIASANRLYKPPQPGQGQAEHAPYRCDVLPVATAAATCGRVSPSNAMFAIGCSYGGVKLVMYTKNRSPPQASINAASSVSAGDGISAAAEGSESNDAQPPMATATSESSAQQNSNNANNDLEAESEHEMSSVDDVLSAGEEGDANNSLNSMFLGTNALNDPLCAELAANEVHGFGLAEEMNDVCVVSLMPAHRCPVVNITIDSWKVSTVDAFVSAHVYEIKTRTLLFSITPGMSPTQMGYSCVRNPLVNIIAMDCEAKMHNPRHIMWQNGTLILSPLPVSSHTLIADFSNEFERPRKVETIKEGKPTGNVIIRKSDSERYFTADRKAAREAKPLADGTVPTVDRLTDRVVVPMLRVPLSFHILYVLFPPITLFIIILTVILIAIRLDGYITVPWSSLLPVHLLLLPHYFSINAYWWKPLLAHYSGPSFILRVVADVLYLVLTPVLYCLKQDGFLLDKVSWVFITWPLSAAIVMALIAARLEDAFEKRHRVTLNPEAANAKYIRISLLQLAHTIVIVALVTHVSIYFDGAPVDDLSYSSFSYSSQNIFIVFIPAWVLLAAYSTRVPSFVSFTPDPNRLVRTWIQYILTLTGLGLLYCIFAVVPVVLLCFKYDNWYEYTRNPKTVKDIAVGVSNATNASSVIPTTLTYENTKTSTVSELASVPMIAIVSPLILALALMWVALANNLVNQWRHLRRVRGG